jgi:hypothetical protein
MWPASGLCWQRCLPLYPPYPSISVALPPLPPSPPLPSSCPTTALTQVDCVWWQLPRQLLRHCANPGSGQAVAAGGQHAHHKLEQAAGGAQGAVEKDAAQEGTEEAVDDVSAEPLLLVAGGRGGGGGRGADQVGGGVQGYTARVGVEDGRGR